MRWTAAATPVPGPARRRSGRAGTRAAAADSAAAAREPADRRRRPGPTPAGATRPPHSTPYREVRTMADPAHSALPLPDYDHLPLGGLESRVRSLNTAEVEELLAYERTHADRLPVTELLSARLEQLRAGAEPTSGDPGALRPETGAARGGSPVTPATSPQPFGPPPHGTPDQRGKPKGDRT